MQSRPTHDIQSHPTKYNIVVRHVSNKVTLTPVMHGRLNFAILFGDFIQQYFNSGVETPYKVLQC